MGRGKDYTVTARILDTKTGISRRVEDIPEEELRILKMRLLWNMYRANHREECEGLQIVDLKTGKVITD